MSLPTTTSIRGALRSTLAAAYTSFQVSGYALANPTPPCIDLLGGVVTYDAAMARGMDDITWIVRVMVPWNLDQAWQSILDNMVDSTGSNSLKTNLEVRDSNQARSLGGVVSDCRVTQASEYKLYPQVGGSDVLGVEFTVQVIP